LLIAVTALAAYAQYTTASLGGTVLDPSSAPVADAKSHSAEPRHGLEANDELKADGTYAFTALPVGNYQISVEKPGFSKYVQSGITLVLDQAANIAVKLKIGDLTQQVNVSADAELVNAQSGTVGQLIDQRKIIELPLDGPPTRRAAVPGRWHSE